MSLISERPALRWGAPIAVAAVVVSVGALGTRLTASAEATLPARSAAQLLIDVQTADVAAGSGTVVQKADLGLPQLPSIGGSGSSSLTSLISGNHTLRVWYAGRSKARVSLMGTLGESDVIRNGRDLWTWSSDTNSATHRLLPADGSDQQSTTGDQADTGAGLTPQQAADQALAAIDPTTVVSTDGSARVAGRAAYELVLAPRDSTSLVGSVRIAVDAAQHVPLRVQVFAKGQSAPSIEVGFTRISFATPSDSQFHFAPPPGVKVTENGATSGDSAAPSTSAGGPVVSGTGWTAVAQAMLPFSSLPEGGTGAQGGSADQVNAILRALPRVSGSWGSGRLLRSHLFSALLTDDGRALVGAVAPERLYELAAQPIPAQSSDPLKAAAAGSSS